MKNTHNIKTSVVIVAGGMGKRMEDDTPKAFILLDNKPLFTYSLLTFDGYPSVAEVILVVPEIMRSQASEIVGSLALAKPLEIIAGDEERWESVRNGVVATDSSIEWVMIHDAARPFVTKKIIGSLLEMRKTFLCAISATPLNDTIRSFNKERCLETVDRSSLLRVGTPQLFNRQELCKAFDQAKLMKPPPTDEAMIMEQCGIKVGYAWGEDTNFKITTKSDLLLAEAILRTNRY